MLATYRLPLLDARSFAADVGVVESVVLPPSWNDGDFVRGMGRVTDRPGGAVERWRHEDAFVNLERTLIFPPSAVQALNRKTEHSHVHTIRKRAWLASPDWAALLDVDLGLQINPVGLGGVAYPRDGQFDLKGVVDLIAAGAALPVHLRSDEPGQTHRLIELGKPLAGHYASSTSDRREGDALVKSGRITVVVEAPGLSPIVPESFRSKKLGGGQVRLASLDATVPGGPKLRVHVLSSERGTKGDRKRIRELRIHILRMHSAVELMSFLAKMMTRPPLPFAETQGEPGFDQLQSTLLDCVRLVRSRTDVGGASPASVLNAVSANTFGDRDLQRNFERMLGAMRRKVRTEFTQLVKDMEAEERRADSTDAANRRDKQLPVTYNTFYSIEGAHVGNKFEFKKKVNAGAIGDHASVNPGVVGDEAKVEGDVVTGHTFTIGNQPFDREDLLRQLKELREFISASNDERGTVATRHLALAERAAQDEDPKGIIEALKNTGSWAVKTAGEIGASIAQAAIQAAIGL